MPTSAVYSQADFPAILKWQAIAFMRMEWSYIFTDDEQFLSETYPVEFQPVHFVVTEGDTLISYAATVDISLEHANNSYKVCGLGNVFTFPPYRREGNGRKVLQLAIKTIKQSDADVAILFCEPSNVSFYTSEDWSVRRSPTYVADGADYYEYDEQRLMLFISDKGKQGQKDFEQQPVYVDWAW